MKASAEINFVADLRSSSLKWTVFMNLCNFLILKIKRFLPFCLSAKKYDKRNCFLWGVQSSIASILSKFWISYLIWTLSGSVRLGSAGIFVWKGVFSKGILYLFIQWTKESEVMDFQACKKSLRFPAFTFISWSLVISDDMILTSTDWSSCAEGRNFCCCSICFVPETWSPFVVSWILQMGLWSLNSVLCLSCLYLVVVSLCWFLQ